MRKLLLSVIASLSVFLCGMNVYAIKLLDLEVYNGDDYESPGTHRILDILTGEYVRVGSLVQVIWAGPNGEVDLINLTNFMPGGDDQVLLYDFGAFDGVKEAFARIGDGYVEDGEGRLITCALRR